MVNETLTNTTTAPIVVTYVYTITASGCVNTNSVTVTVNPTPILNSTLTPAAICSGSTFSYTATSATAGATFGWSRATIIGIAQAGTIGAGAAVSEVLTNTTASPISVTYVYTITANGCVNTNNVVVTVNPVPALSSTLTPPAICSGTAFNYTPASATAGATFAWTRAAVPGITEAATGGAADVSEVLTNTTTAPISVTYVYITTANGCSSAPQNVVVVVHPIPVLNSTLTPAAICSGSAFNYTATSSTVGATFGWSRAAIAGITQAATSGVGATVSEVLTNTTTAPISVIYIYTITASGCVNTNSVAVTVNPTPVLSSTLTPPAICSGATFSYTATSATAGASFAWTRAARAGITEAATSGTGDVSEVLTNTTASPINVTYIYITTANGCSGPPRNVVVTVNPTPVLSSTLTPASICSGATFTYTATSLTAGTSYGWTRAAVPGITQAGSSGIVAGISEALTNTTTAPISVTYVYTLTANGCVNTQNVTVTVNPIPVLSSTLTPAAICSGTTFSYTATSATAGATFGWTRAAVPGITEGATSGAAAAVNETLTNTTPAPIAVTYVYTVTANGCVNTNNVTVTVNPKPVLSSAPPAGICSGSTFSYTATSATAGTTFGWSRAALPGITEAASSGIVASVSEALTNTTTAPINVIYVYTLTANGCVNTQNVTVTVNPIPVLSSTLTPAAICSGANFSYTATSATAGATFGWSRAAVPGITQVATTGAVAVVNETLTNTTPAPIVVTYVYTITASGCVNTNSVTVTVNPTPMLNSTLTPAAICSGSTFSYTATSATAGATFGWSRATIIGIAQAGTIGAGAAVSEVLTNTTASPISVTYVYTITANGCVNTQNVTVTVNPVPALSSTLTPPAICSGTAFNYTPASATAGATFAWTRAAVPGITEAATGGAADVSEVLTNTTTAPISVTYVYITTANGCSSAPQNVVVVVHPIPVLNSTLTPAAICSGSAFNYTATSSTVGATFGWSRAAIAGITQAATSGVGATVSEVLTNTTTAPISVIYIYTITASGCVNTNSVAVTVNPTPVLSSTLTPPAICSGATFSYTATSATAGASFAWTRAARAGITEAATSGTGDVSEVLTNTTASPINVTYIYITTANGCSGPPRNVVVTVNPTPVLSSTLTPASICSGATFTYTATSLTAGTSYGWTRAAVPGITQAGSSGIVAGISEALTNTTTAPISVTYVYTLTANGCVNTQNVTVTVNPIPVLSSTLTPAAICSGTTFSYTATSATAGATFGWTRAAVPGITEGATSGASAAVNETLTNTTPAPIAVTYVYTVTANGCVNTNNVTVTVNPKPVLSSLPPAGICSGSTFSYTATSATAGTTFGWSRAAVPGITEAASSGIVASVSEALTNTTTAPINVIYVYTLTANGCVNTQNVTVTVNPIPVLSSTLTPAAICSGANFSYTATSATAGATFGWSRAAVPGITQGATTGAVAVVNETLTNTTPAPIVVTYVYTITASGCVNTNSVTVTVNPTPVLSSTLTPAAICSGSTFSYTATSATAGATFGWSRG